MKKFARIFALALVCVLSIAALAACGGPNTDIDAAEANLKNKGYAVEVVKKDDVGSSLAFAETALQFDCEVADIEATLEAMKGSEDSLDSLTMVWFVSADLAKSACESTKEQIAAAKKAIDKSIEALEAMLELLPESSRKELQEQLDDAKEQLKSLDSIVISYTGNVFYTGSKDAINATK